MAGLKLTRFAKRSADGSPLSKPEKFTKAGSLRESGAIKGHGGPSNSSGVFLPGNTRTPFKHSREKSGLCAHRQAIGRVGQENAIFDP